LLGAAERQAPMPHSGVPKARGRRRANRMMDAELAASIRQSKSTNGGTEKVKASKRKRIYASRIISDHIMVQEDFERLHKFLLETFTARACRKDPNRRIIASKTTFIRQMSVEASGTAAAMSPIPA
jgi:hypothetical protein